jgi:hypothetical protein
MKKVIIILFLFTQFVYSNKLKADEGMWLPILLEQINQSSMQSLGMKISAKDIYDINHTSLKDAILLFGGGCTAEIISNQGLILTNHHCGYRDIQSHSTLQNDYLKNGFWARNFSEELANPNLTVSLLIRMEDVTEKVLEGVNDHMSQKQRASIIEKNSKNIIKEAVKGTHYTGTIRPFYYGNQYFLFISEVFRDVRLVGAPPSNIGKFGGDTDNWMWPRHTGDFALFRIYVGKDNKPADYSPDNVPYKPKKHLEISLKGVEKNDFTFVFGYPGRTQQFLTSYAVDLLTNYENPARIKMRDKRLEIIGADMLSDPLIRIQYSAKHASIANAWKKWQGEINGIKRLNAVSKKQDFEKEFINWLQNNEAKNKSYSGLLPDFEKNYNDIKSYSLASIYFSEAGLAAEMIRFAYGFKKLIDASKSQTNNDDEIKKTIEQIKSGIPGFYKDFNLNTDKKIFSELMKIYFTDCDKKFQPSYFETINKKFKSNLNNYSEYVYSNSIFSSQEKILNLLNHYKRKNYKKIENDPAYILAENIYNHYIDNIQPKLIELNDRVDSLYRIYVKAIMEMQPQRIFYPDANSTLRVTYGKVDDYKPRDAVKYLHYTTIEGIMQKENPEIYDYIVEPKLKELYKSKDYGRYSNSSGELPIAFIATNHTTGGNSGSPVLNAYGQLVGVNFDRNWEGTMSDIIYDPEQCRNISLDIRYCLFVIDKVAGAKNIIDELTIIN